MPPNHTNQEKAHLLVVDDDSGIRDSVSKYMALSGYLVSAAIKAKEALQILDEHPIDVVITDIVLPGMDGLELTCRIKKSHGADVIVMTGYSSDYSYEEAIHKGASDFIFKPVRFEELLLRLRRVLKDRRLASERNVLLDKFKQLSITDGLTGIYNSRHFYNRIKEEIGRAERYQRQLSLILLDIDQFKKYNDRYGHLEGDKVLVTLGKMIKPCLRKIDSLYRYGGEEFTVILPETKHDEAASVAERVRSTVEKIPFRPKNSKEPVFLSVSVGLTEYFHGEEISDFVQRADRAMYLSKHIGGNRVQFESAGLPN